MLPGLYLREKRERSLLDNSVQALLCQYLNIYNNQTLSLSTVIYVSGDSCVSNPNPPVIMETLDARVSDMTPVNLSIPLSDDTRSDLLGAFLLDPTNETSMRSVNMQCSCITCTCKYLYYHLP